MNKNYHGYIIVNGLTQENQKFLQCDRPGKGRYEKKCSWLTFRQVGWKLSCLQSKVNSISQSMVSLILIHI